MVHNCYFIHLQTNSLKEAFKISIQINMTSLSPSEDLCILAAIYNNPDMTWYQISEFIRHKNFKIIPAYLCEQRYDTFLKHIDHIQEIAEVAPYLQFQNQKTQKIPQNFIFHYVQLKRKIDQATDKKTFGFVGIYEKRIITQSFYGKICKNSKKVQKETKIMSDDVFINNIYKEIKARSCLRTVLNEKILCQKFQQILFEIIQKVNDLLQSCKQEKINVNILKLFKPQCLIDERRQIFQLYFSGKQLKLDEALLIAGKFRYVQTVFGYPNVKKQSENEEYNDCQSQKTFYHPDDLLQSMNQQSNKSNQHQQEEPKIQSPQQNNEENHAINEAINFQANLSQIQNQTPNEQAQAESQGEVKQQIKYEQVKMEIEQNTQNHQQNPQKKQNQVKRYRVFKKRRNVSFKLPSYSKVVIVIND